MSLIVTLFTSWGSVGTILQVNEKHTIQFHKGAGTMTIHRSPVEIDGEVMDNDHIYQLTGDVEIKSQTGAIIQLVKLADLIRPPLPDTPESKEFWMSLLKSRLKGISKDEVWKARIRTHLNNGLPVSVYIPKPYFGDECPIVLLGYERAFFAVFRDHELYIEPSTTELAYAAIGVDEITRAPLPVNGSLTFNLSEEETINLIGGASA
ncbi:hypothetical protein D3C79_48050 [compost metagenome]